MRKILIVMLSVLLLNLQLLAQNRTVTGKVTDATGAPVAGASIQVKNTNVGAVTRADGTYSISVPANGKTLVISGADVITQEIGIGTQAALDVTLQATNRNLQEVVVTGYTSRRRSEFTGAAAKVDAKQIEQVPMASFEQILQGRAPGLYIASGSGQPGTTTTRVNIRGVSTIGGNSDPLYVLDGIPIEAGVFRSLNPNDFESVDVLKDAAGAGQYGSRGANGVIVITSKKGRAGKNQITYRGQYGVAQPPPQRRIRLMNTAERLQYEEQVLGANGLISGVTTTNGLPVLGANNGLTGYPGWDYSPNNPRFGLLTGVQRTTEAAQLDSIRQINTDWADLFFRNGKFQQHEVNASGGSNNFTYFTSLSMYKQEGVIIRSNLDRYTFRGNLDFKTDRLTVAVRSNAGWSSLSNIEAESAVNLSNPIAAAYLELPYRKPFNATGKTITGAGLTGANAYDRLFTTTSLSNQFKANLGISVQFNIWNGISLRTNNGVDWRNTNASRFIAPGTFAGGLVAQGAQGSYNETNAENLQLITTTGLVYNKNIGEGKHVINAQAMVESIRNKFRSFNATGFGINPNLPLTPAGVTAGSSTNNFIPLLGGSRTLNGLFSTFLLGDYTYNRKYTISGSIRRDAPSQVPEKNRDNYFWTAGASWNVIQESFLANQNIVQDLRFRASYGRSANVNGFTSNFGYISTYGTGGYAGVPGIIPTSPGNLDYRLESQTITNIGLDVAFLDRRLKIAADYYIKKSEDLFVNQNLSLTTGFTALDVNAGQVRNTGVDFVVTGEVLRKKDLTITVGVNGNFNKNEVTSLGGLSEIPQGTGIVRIGYPIGTHFTVGYLGVDPSSGLPVYEDLKGNPTTIFNAANQRAEYGTFLPAFTGGATLDVTFKNFSASALFTTAQKVWRFNNEAFFYETTNSNIQFNKRIELLTQTWQKPGDMTNYQRITAQRQFSSRDIQDASFVRFRNLQVGYLFDTKKTKLANSVRLWVQGQNLYTWSKWQGFDPEESNNIANYEFPSPRTFTFGLDVNF